MNQIDGSVEGNANEYSWNMADLDDACAKLGNEKSKDLASYKTAKYNIDGSNGDNPKAP